MQVDRRRNHRLRALFDEAYDRIEPCFEMRPSHGLPIEWIAYRAARDAYPQLSPLELFQLAKASVRVYRSRRARLPGRPAY